jgi:hypothetical protein
MMPNRGVRPLGRHERPDEKSLSIRQHRGQNQPIMDDTLGLAHDILNGIGLVERNFEPWKK